MPATGPSFADSGSDIDPASSSFPFIQEQGPAPDGYARQDADWFDPGRYLRIWAEEERDIHQYEFIIIEARNMEGNAVRVYRIPGRMPPGWGRTMIALDGPGNPSNRYPRISLEEWSLDGNGPKNRYVRLDHTYTLPFGKYACQDLGMLGFEGLQTLRQQSIKHSSRSWDVVERKLVSTQLPPSDVTKRKTTSMVQNETPNKEATSLPHGEASSESHERTTTAIWGGELDVAELGIEHEPLEARPCPREGLMSMLISKARRASQDLARQTIGYAIEMTSKPSKALPPSPHPEHLPLHAKNTYRDEHSDGEDASLVFSLDSIASSATSVSNSGSSSRLPDFIRVIAVKLFNGDALNRLITAAAEDADVDEDNICYNIGRMVRIFGKDLQSETNDASERSVAHAMQIPSVATHAACEVVLHFDTARSKRPGKLDRSVAAHRDENQDEDSEAEIESASEDDSEVESTSENYGDLTRTHDFLLSSNAYVAFKRGLLDFVHAPYRRRIFKALGEVVIDESGAQHGAAYLSGLSHELSWVPTDLFRFSGPSNASLLDTLKSNIEQTVGDQWQWWPFDPPNRPLKVGWEWLHWQSPCGTPRCIGIPQERKEALQQAFATSPRFINIHDTHPAGNQIPSGNTESQRKPQGILAPGSAPTKPAQSNRGRGRRRQYADSEKAPGRALSPTGAHGITQSACTGGFNKKKRYLYLRVNDSSHVPSCVRMTSVRNDHGFFAELNTEYCRARGWLRTYLSMWRYDRCEFYRFQRFGVKSCHPKMVGFPPLDDNFYDYEPRPIGDEPPHGPITSSEFHDRFYKTSHTFFDWRDKQCSDLFLPYEKRCLSSLPKRVLVLEDGGNIEFYGLYAKEKFAFAWFLAYFVACLLPGFMFFFFYVFQWKHTELSNGAFPITLTVTTFACLMTYVTYSHEK